MTQNMPAVLNAIPEAYNRPNPREFVSASGVVLKLRPVSPMLINDVRHRLKPPQVPKVRNADKGDDVWEDNPNDPTYLEQLREYQILLAETANATILAMGSDVLRVPESHPKVEDTEWADEVLELAGIEVPKAGRRRYFCWLKYTVLLSLDEWQRLIEGIQSISGVTTERQVAQAIENFRDSEEGDTPTGVHSS